MLPCRRFQMGNAQWKDAIQEHYHYRFIYDSLFRLHQSVNRTTFNYKLTSVKLGHQCYKESNDWITVVTARFNKTILGRFEFNVDRL